MTRAISNWIDAFYEHTEPLPSPPLFRKWAAIACVAGALERRVWVRTFGRNLYPNLYTVLVGPPGVGKTVLSSLVWQLWTDLGTHHVASSSVTRASLIDELKDATRNEVLPSGDLISSNPLLISSNELGVLLPAYENDFMNTLTDLYDGLPYTERRRTRDIKVKIDHPQLNLFAATTPSYLHGVLPEGAWDQGFVSRLIIVFSTETQLRELFIELTRNEAEYKALSEGLAAIAKLYGKITFTVPAAELISEWHMAGGKPIPSHPRLSHYITRRTAHLLKLCMVACVADTDSLEITVEHYQTALGWLNEVETHMEDLFKTSSSQGQGRVIEETWHFIYKLYMQRNAPVPEAKLIAFLQERVPVHSVLQIIDIMERAGLLVKQHAEIGYAYVPKQRNPN